MNRIHKLMAGAAGTLALVAVSAVVAAPPAMGGCEGPGPLRAMHGGGPGPGADMAAMAERHLTDLKARLKITLQQESAWQAFANQAAANAQAMQAAHAQRQATTDTALPAPDRMAQHITEMQQHLAGMQAVQSAFKDLYAALTPEQKAIADRHAQHMGGQGHAGRDEHGMGDRG